MHFCHSQGTLHTRNALLALPSEVRARVIVVALAPAVVVSRDLCYDAFNYASKDDLIPTLGTLCAYVIEGGKGEKEREKMLQELSQLYGQLIFLESKSDSWIIGADHELQSPTLREEIKKRLEDYFKNQGIYP